MACSFSCHMRPTWRDLSLNLTLVYYVTCSVTMIDKYHISWIIEHNTDCTTPVIQAGSLRITQTFLQRNLSLTAMIRGRENEARVGDWGEKYTIRQRRNENLIQILQPITINGENGHWHARVSDIEEQQIWGIKCNCCPNQDYDKLFQFLISWKQWTGARVLHCVKTNDTEEFKVEPNINTSSFHMLAE